METNNAAFVDENVIPEAQEPWAVTDDQTAEWCLDKIREARNEKEKWAAFYDEQKARAMNREDNRILFFEGKLAVYFAKVPHKISKTQESYQLPSGKLVRKQQGPDFERDEEQLLPWLKENIPALVKVKESADWANLKKHLTVLEDGRVADPDGEIVPGVRAVEQPDVFKVEVKA